MQRKDESTISLPRQQNNEEEQMKDQSQNTKQRIKQKLKSCANKLIQFLECSSVFTLQKIQEIHDEELVDDLQGSENSDQYSSYSNKRSYRSYSKSQNTSEINSQKPKKTVIWFKERQNFDDSVHDRYQSRMSQQTQETINRQYRTYLQTRTRRQEFTEWFFCEPPKVYDDYWSRQACPLADYLTIKKQKQKDFNYNYYDYDLDQSQSMKSDQKVSDKISKYNKDQVKQQSIRSDGKSQSKIRKFGKDQVQSQSIKSNGKVSDKIKQSSKDLDQSQSIKSDAKVSSKMSNSDKQQFNEMDRYLLSIPYEKRPNKKNSQQVKIKEEEDYNIERRSDNNKNNQENEKDNKTETKDKEYKQFQKKRIRKIPAKYQKQDLEKQHNISHCDQQSKQQQQKQLDQESKDKLDQQSKIHQTNNIQSHDQSEKEKPSDLDTEEQKAKEKILDESMEQKNSQVNTQEINNQLLQNQSENVVERESSLKLQNWSDSKVQGPTYKKQKKPSKINKMKVITTQHQQQQISFDFENLGNQQQFIVDAKDEENEISIIYDQLKQQDMAKREHSSHKKMKKEEASFMSEIPDKCQTQSLKYNKKRRRKYYQPSNQPVQSHNKSKKQQISQEEEPIEAIFYLDEQEIQ